MHAGNHSLDVLYKFGSPAKGLAMNYLLAASLLLDQGWCSVKHGHDRRVIC